MRTFLASALLLVFAAGCPGGGDEDKCKTNPNLLECIKDTDPDGTPGDSKPTDSEDSGDSGDSDSGTVDPCAAKGGDSDKDGVCDDDDPCPTIKNDNDTDGDGVCDSIDPCPLDNPDDSDGDGVCDSSDPCPLDKLDDRDGDGACDSDDPCPDDRLNDRDGDGVCDSLDPCPLDNPDDPDSDGLCSSNDPCPNNPGSTDSNDCDTGETGVLVPTPADLAQGELVITEVHVNPEGCTNRYGQYLEVKNTTTGPVNLRGLRVRFANGASVSTVDVKADVFVPAAEYAVLRPAWTSQFLGCGYTSLTADYLYDTSMQFTISGGVISVLDSTDRALDVVDLAAVSQGSQGATAENGYAIHINVSGNPNRESATANDQRAVWCLAPDEIGGGNHGSPGAAGMGCAEIVVPESGDSGDTAVVVESTPPTGTTFKTPAAGDLLLSEVMLRPEDCGITANRGRYIELVNRTNQWLTLEGVVLDWGSAEGIALFPRPGGDLYIAPGERFVAHSLDASLQTCHGVQHSLRFFHPLSSEPRRMRVRKDAVIIEEVDFGGAGWGSFPTGASLGFDPAFEAQPALNTNRLNWCPQEGQLPNRGFDQGTPNLANSVCTDGPGTDPEPQETDIPQSCIDNTARNPVDGLDAAELCEGDLVVTEVMFDPIDCDPQQAQYIEVYNASGVVVRPAGLQVLVDDPLTTDSPDLARGLAVRAGSTTSNTIAPGTYAALVLPSATTYCYAFTRNFQLNPSIGTSVLFPGVLQLTTGAYLVDQVDFSTFSGIPAGRALQLDPEISPTYAPNNDNEAAWCADGPTLQKGGALPVGDRGTPGAANNCTPDVVDTGAPADSDSRVDTDDGRESFGPPECEDTGGCETDDSTPVIHTDPPDDGILQANELIFGDLVITEVMYDPQACGGGASAQYVEVYNTTNLPIDASGVQVDIGTNRFGKVRRRAGATATDYLPPNAYSVLAMASTTPFCFPASEAKFEIALVTMGRSPTDVRFYNDNVSSIDAVNLAQPGVPLETCPGRAVQLAPAAARSPTDNNDLANWCPSGKRITGFDDYGSPGAAGSCGSCDTVDTDPKDSTPVDDGILQAGELQAGDLLITEIMDASRCSQSESDYIEIYNNTEFTIDLKDVQFRQKNASINNVRVIPNSYLLPRNGYALITRALTPGVQRCYASEPSFATFSAFWQLAVGGQAFSFEHDRGGIPFVIDAVDTTPTSWDVFDSRDTRLGRSVQLNAQKFTPTANNSSSNWCSTPVVSGYEIPRRAGNTKIDYGTPGRPNDPCFFVPLDSEASIADPEESAADSEVIPPDTALDLAQLSPGALVITEFMVQPSDCSPEDRAEYIEIYNTTSSYVDLRYLEVSVGFDVARIYNETVVGPQQYAVLRNGKRPENEFCYPQVPVNGKLGTSANGDHIGSFSNGGALITITDANGRVFDQVDYDPFPPVVGKAWELVANARDTASNDDLQAWCLAVDLIPGATGDRGTPGKANTCTLVVEPPDPDVRTVAELVRGDLVITEIMPATLEDGCGGAAGAQWFELTNTSNFLIDLLGLDLSNRFDNVRNRVLEHVYVAKGQRVVLSRYRADGRCYDPGAAYEYPTMLLTETGDELRLLAGTRVIDEVDFQGWPITPGRSMQVDPARVNADQNDDWTVWCAANGPTPIVGATHDRGSPGKLNAACDIYTPDPDDTGPPVDTAEPTTCPIPGVSPWSSVGGGADVDTLSPGDLVITEVMSGPKDCGDAYAEYVEIYNTLPVEVNLNGLALQTSTGTFRIATDVFVGPSSYALGLPDVDVTCYLLGACATFRYTGVSFADTGTPVRLRNRSNIVIDEIDTSSFPVPIYGASWNLGSASLDGDDNDAPEAWCASTTPIPGATDRGTPGAPNQVCGTPTDTDDTYKDTGETDPVVTGEVKALADLVLGELVLTEVHTDPRECSDTAGEFIELYNNGTLPIDLNGIVIGNNRDSVQISRQPRRLVIRPGEYMVFRYASQETCYNFTASVFYTSVTLDPARAFVYIGGAGKLLDVVPFASFGESPGASWQVDPVHLAAVVPGGVGEAIGTVSFTKPYPGLLADDWCPSNYKLPGATGDKGNPGKPSTPCLSDTDIVPHTGTYVAHVDEFEAGDLVINEIMADPNDCPDLFGEWLEIRNDGPYAVDLKDLRVQSSQSSAVVAVSYVLEQGELALIRRASGISDCYPELVPDLLVPNMVLPNGAGFVRLANVHSTLDLVDYTAIGTRPGRSLAVDPDFSTAALNDDPAAWCFQEGTFLGATRDTGTPGVANDECTTSIATVPVTEVEPGDLVITELLIQAANCGTDYDQYIELTNMTDHAIRLVGLRWQVANVGTEGRITTVPGSSNPDSIVEAGQPFVLKTKGTFCVPRFLPDGTPWWDYEYTQPFLNPNGGDTLRVVKVMPDTSRVTLDELNFRNWPDAGGNSFQLQPDSYNILDNDDLDNWCISSQRIPRSLTGGTPGEPNDCSIDTDPILDTVETGPVPLGYDTGFFDVAMIIGSVDVVPNALFRGTLTRWVGRGVPGITAATEEIDIDVVLPRLVCAYQWSFSEDQTAPNSNKGRLTTTTVCPTCEWGFAVKATGRVDVGGRYGRPSQCTNQFDAYGGTPPTVATRRLYGSRAYGGIFTETTLGTLVPYTYDATLEPGVADWKIVIYANPLP